MAPSKASGERGRGAAEFAGNSGINSGFPESAPPQRPNRAEKTKDSKRLLENQACATEQRINAMEQRIRR
jgi:hypothetical protein